MYVKEHRGGVNGTRGFGEEQAGLCGWSVGFVGEGSQGPGWMAGWNQIMISFTEQAAGGVWPLGDKDPFSSVGWYLLRPFYYCCRWGSRGTEGQGLPEKMRGRERLEKE